MKLGRMLGKVAQVVSPAYGAYRGARDAKKAEREGMRQYEQQQNAIRQQGQAAQVERDRVASQRARAEARLRAGSVRANRRRVRGGLFGEGQAQENINPRLG